MSKRPWYELKARADQPAELWIYDEIGEGWYTEGVTAKALVTQLAALDGADLNVHINSPGGSVWDGQAIYTALVQHPGKVTTYIDGLAASIASVIALAGDTVIMADNAMMMIHAPWTLAMDNAEGLRREADVLDKIGESMVGVYTNATGKTAEEIRAIMDAETWFTAQEALDFGLVSEIAQGRKMAAMSFDLSKFRHAPAPAATDHPGQPAATISAGRDTPRKMDADMIALMMSTRR